MRPTQVSGACRILSSNVASCAPPRLHCRPLCSSSSSLPCMCNSTRCHAGSPSGSTPSCSPPRQRFSGWQASSTPPASWLRPCVSGSRSEGRVGSPPAMRPAARNNYMQPAASPSPSAPSGDGWKLQLKPVPGVSAGAVPEVTAPASALTLSEVTMAEGLHNSEATLSEPTALLTSQGAVEHDNVPERTPEPEACSGSAADPKPSSAPRPYLSSPEALPLPRKGGLDPELLSKMPTPCRLRSKDGTSDDTTVSRQRSVPPAVDEALLLLAPSPSRLPRRPGGAPNSEAKAKERLAQEAKAAAATAAPAASELMAPEEQKKAPSCEAADGASEKAAVALELSESLFSTSPSKDAQDLSGAGVQACAATGSSSTMVPSPSVQSLGSGGISLDWLQRSPPSGGGGAGGCELPASAPCEKATPASVVKSLCSFWENHLRHQREVAEATSLSRDGGMSSSSRADIGPCSGTSSSSSKPTACAPHDSAANSGKSPLVRKLSVRRLQRDMSRQWTFQEQMAGRLRKLRGQDDLCAASPEELASARLQRSHGSDSEGSPLPPLSLADAEAAGDEEETAALRTFEETSRSLSKAQRSTVRLLLRYLDELQEAERREAGLGESAGVEYEPFREPDTES
eukprot:TRINITY_DN12771_c0_g1_i2.p1 TRINITY_DN12771_c0_g1~~TRINITY_DN12771_c0_g1_i2.p1  ORF type:complete len:628 (-),score=121.15 TRINITY_DN12771_c0_g1_i2:99-1982(-)